MTCQQFLDALDCYIDGELSATASAGADAHRRECSSCASAADRILLVKHSVKQTVERVRVPDALESRVVRGLAASQAAPSRRRSRRQLRWAAAVAAVLMVGVGGAALRPTTDTRAADVLDRLALRVDEDSVVTLEGTVLCRDCELEHRYGVKASCQVIGHHGAIATADGRIWNIVEQRESASLIHDESVLGKRIVAQGRILRGARAIVIERYQIVS